MEEAGYPHRLPEGPTPAEAARALEGGRIGDELRRDAGGLAVAEAGPQAC